MSGLPQGNWTLKAELAGDLRRLSPWPAAGGEPSAAAAREAVARLFDFPAEEVESLVLKYQDDEGDLCTLTESSLTDALCLAAERPGRVLRLQVKREAARPPPTDAGADPAERTAGQSGAEAARPPPAGAGADPAEGPAGQGGAEVSAPRTEAVGTAGQAWSLLRRFSQRVQEEVHTTAAELQAAATEPNGLRTYSGVLQGRLTSHVEEARSAAAQVRSAATAAYSQASHGDAKAGLGLAAAVAVPAAVVALAPGRCTRLSLLAAGALAAAKLGDSLTSSSPAETSAEQPQPQEQQPQAQQPQAEAEAVEANTPSDGAVRQRAAPHFSGEPTAQLD